MIAFTGRTVVVSGATIGFGRTISFDRPVHLEAMARLDVAPARPTP